MKTLRIRTLYMIFIAALMIAAFCNLSSEEVPVQIKLAGFLGKEEVAHAKNTLENINQGQNKRLILIINSSSGDLQQVLDLAKNIYEQKFLYHIMVSVYIDSNAIGPAAILPFLADELYVSPFVSWGDIPLGTEGIVPTNILRNRVRSLINDSRPESPMLFLMADAMSDPGVEVEEEEGGWKIVSDKKDRKFPLISSLGQTLVVNQNQLKRLNLVEGILTLQQFESKLGISQTTEKPSVDHFSQQPLAISPVTLEDELKKHIQFSQTETNNIGYIVIDDRTSGINQSTWLYVKQALEHYKVAKPIFIILELNTPGGEVFPAQKISDALKEMDTQYNIPVIAYINNWAISAGAMLAYSCRFIAVVKDGSMGAAEPVYAGESGQMVTASEKVNSALRTDFANRASFFDRNPLIAEAMVDKDIILVFRNNKIVKLDNENQIRTAGSNPDIVISPKGKLLTMTAEQLVEYGVADFLLKPEKLAALTDSEVEKGVWPASKALLFQEAYFEQIPHAQIEAYQMDWKNRFFAFLATPIVSSLLFMGLLVGAYVEINTPGFGFPGTIAALCLFLIIISNFSLELTNWLELIFLFAGLTIILLELFILPTSGFLGVIGGVFFLIGLFGIMLPGINSIGFEYDTKTLNAAGQYFIARIAWLGVSLIASVVIMVLLTRYALPSFSGFNRIVLKGHEQDASLGYIAGASVSSLPLVGTKGVVAATLRPAGKVVIDDVVYDAVSAGGFIDLGVEIVVVNIEAGQLIVNSANGTHIL